MNSISSCFHSRDNLEAARSFFFVSRYLFSYKNSISMQYITYAYSDLSKRISRGEWEETRKRKWLSITVVQRPRPLQLRWKFDRIARACRPDWWDCESRRRPHRRRIVVAFGVLRAIHARSIVRKITLARARFGGRCNCLEKERGKKKNQWNR